MPFGAGLQHLCVSRGYTRCTGASGNKRLGRGNRWCKAPVLGVCTAHCTGLSCPESEAGAGPGESRGPHSPGTWLLWLGCCRQLFSGSCHRHEPLVQSTASGKRERKKAASHSTSRPLRHQGCWDCACAGVQVALSGTSPSPQPRSPPWAAPRLPAPARGASVPFPSCMVILRGRLCHISPCSLGIETPDGFKLSVVNCFPGSWDPSPLPSGESRWSGTLSLEPRFGWVAGGRTPREGSASWPCGESASL